MKCPNCRTATLVQIAMRLRDRDVTLHACSNCDTRWWEVDGEVLGLGDVLELAAK